MLSVIGVSRRSLMVAAIGLLLVSPALAETVTINDITASTEGDATLTVPTVELTDANIGEEEVRAFFGIEGTLADRAKTLVGLSARSISIPELRIEGGAGTENEGSLSFTGVTLTGVAHGIAGGFSVEGAVFEGKDGKVAFGPFSMTNVNADYLFALQGLGGSTEGLDPRDLEPIWSALTLGGATATGPTGTCTVADINGGAVAIRMMQRGTLQALIEQSEKVQKRQRGETPEPDVNGEPDTAAGDATETPATEAPATPDTPMRSEADELALLQSYYYDALGSYAADPITFAGVECNVTSDSGDPIILRVDELAIGVAEPGTLPEIAFSGLYIENTGSDAGWLQLDSLRILSTDYAAVAALFDEAGIGIDGNFLEARQRELIPSFGGFEMTGLTMDVPSDATPGTRIVGGIESTSLLFDSYVHGIPTDIRATATGVSFAPPEGQAGQMLAMLGLDPFDLSYDIAIRWDQAAREIVIDNILLNVGNGGTIIVSGVLGNARPQLFALDESVSQAAGQQLTLKELNLHVADAGILEKLVAMAAGQQKADPDQFRGGVAAMTQAMVLMGLGATPDAIKVAGALNRFISTGGEVSLSAVSLDPAGVSLAEFAAGQSDPTAVIRKFSLTVGEPEAEAPDAAVETTAPEAPAAAPEQPAGGAEPAPAAGTEVVPDSGTKEKTE